MIPFACLLACCIPAGDIPWQLNMVSVLTDVQILYDFHSFNGAGPKVCGRTTNELLAGILEPRGGYWDWVTSEAIAVLPENPWCEPELGANAPSPPCRKATP